MPEPDEEREAEVANAIVAAAVSKRVEQLTGSKAVAVAAFVAVVEVLGVIEKAETNEFQALDDYLTLSAMEGK